MNLHDLRGRVAITLFGLAALFAFYGAIAAPASNAKSNTTKAVADATKSAGPTSITGPVTVQAEGRGAPFYKLQDGRQMVVTYRGADAGARALQSGQAEPRVLTSADFDGNATPDVVAGYAEVS